MGVTHLPSRAQQICESPEYKEGYKAYHQNKKLNDNPYDWHEPAGLWAFGWEDAWLDD